MKRHVLLLVFLTTAGLAFLAACNQVLSGQPPTLPAPTETTEAEATPSPVPASRTPLPSVTSTQAATPTIATSPTMTATIPVTPTLDISQMDVTEWSSTSPDGQWIAEGMNALPTAGGSQYYTRMVVRSTSGAPQWTIVDSWQNFGLGYTTPYPLQWIDSFFYYTNLPVADGCAIFVNGSDLHEVNLEDGSVRQILPSSGHWLTISPDASAVAYIPWGSQSVHVRSFTSADEQQFPLDQEDATAGYLVWSPDGEELALTLAHQPCAGGRLAESTSILRVNRESGEVTPVIERDERLMITVSWESDGTIILLPPEGTSGWHLNPDTGELTEAEIGIEAPPEP